MFYRAWHLGSYRVSISVQQFWGAVAVMGRWREEVCGVYIYVLVYMHMP